MAITMDPPGRIASSHPPPPQQQKQLPQPFEIALVRKLESKTASVRTAFLLLDADGDGRISPSDLRAVLHNELGFDITDEQENIFFARRSEQQQQQQQQEQQENENQNSITGMGYAEFTKYFAAVSSVAYPTSQSGLAAAAGFERDTANDDDPERANSEMAYHLQPHTILHLRRRQLRQLFTAHSCREGEPCKSGSGMKDTSLFLAIDVHRSGKVTMLELLDWLNTVGSLDWSIEDLKMVVLGDDIDNNGDGDKRDELELKWFGGKDEDDAEREAGMVEHEFAEFVESLDGE